MEVQWQQQLAEAEQKLVLWVQDLTRKLPQWQQESPQSTGSSARRVPSKLQRRQDATRGTVLQRRHTTGSGSTSTTRAPILQQATSNPSSTASVVVQEDPVPARLSEQTDKNRSPPKQQKAHKDLSGAEKALRHLLAGATAAIVAKSAVAPLERLKLDYMLSSFSGPASAATGASTSELVGAGGAQLWAQAGTSGAVPAVTAIPAVAPQAGRALKQLQDATHRILVEEGWQGLWRGNGVNLLRIVPFKTLNFFFFDVFRAQLTKQRLRRQRQKRKAVARQHAPGQASGSSQTWGGEQNPGQGPEPGSWKSRGLRKTAGPGVAGLLGAARDTLQGLGAAPSLASAAGSLLGLQGHAGRRDPRSIDNGPCLTTDTDTKYNISTSKIDSDMDTDTDDLNTSSTNVERAIAGAASGTVAAIVCFPLDTVRTRLVARGGMMCAGDILGCFVDLVRYEGIASLYRGLLPALLSMAPAGAVFYGTYDFLKAAHLKAAASAAARQGGADGTVPAAAQQRGVFAVKQTGETGTRGEVGEGAERRRREGGLHGEMDSERRDAQKDAGTSQGAGAPSCSHSDSGPGDTIEATGHRSLGQDPPGGSASKEWPVPNSGHHGGSTSRQEPQGMGTREMQAAQQEGQQVHEQVALLVRHPPLPQQQSALQQLGVLPTLVYGAMAGAAAELATFPLEVVRRQMQLGGKTGRGGPLDIARVMKEVVQKGGGPQALYAGILPATLQVLPSAAISYLIFEVMKTWLKIDS